MWTFAAEAERLRAFPAITPELLAAPVCIDGIRKTFAEMTPDDLCRLAEVERERATADALARLDAVDERWSR